jgi:hypothetical protein
MGIRMFGRGQLELGTDTVQCQGESNGQGGKSRRSILRRIESRMMFADV